MFNYILGFLERAPGLEAQSLPLLPLVPSTYSNSHLPTFNEKLPIRAAPNVSKGEAQMNGQISQGTTEQMADSVIGQPIEMDEPLITRIQLRQKIDGKSLLIDARTIGGLLPRYDQDGEEFLQINFEAGYKILVTKNLVGFKPALTAGLDRSNLPNVVTTPDILNVLDAIHDASEDAHASDVELKSLKRVFEAVILGGELVGFDLTNERGWLFKFPPHAGKISS